MYSLGGAKNLSRERSTSPHVQFFHQGKWKWVPGWPWGAASKKGKLTIWGQTPTLAVLLDLCPSCQIFCLLFLKMERQGWVWRLHLAKGQFFGYLAHFKDENGNFALRKCFWPYAGLPVLESQRSPVFLTAQCGLMFSNAFETLGWRHWWNLSFL